MKNMKYKIFSLICIVAIAAFMYIVSGSFTVSRIISAETESTSNAVTESDPDAYTESEDSTETVADASVDSSDTTSKTLSNQDIDESTVTDPESLIDMNAAYPYEIYVNRILNRVVVYGIDYNGDYSVPYKGFVCSVGAEGHETPLGTFSISDKYEWREMVDGSYAQYATRIYKGIMFHSVPYYSPSKDDLETEEYNKLGTAASLGCVRLAVDGIKWIYDNCPKGTTVVIYDDEDEQFPITFEDAIRLPVNDEYSGWDPTDPDVDNPWKTTQIDNITEK